MEATSPNPYRRHRDEELGGEDGEGEICSTSDAFFIPPKNAPLERLRRWRQAALVLNASRRFRYTLDLKKEEEKEHIRRKIRAHAQVIRAAFLFKEAGEREKPGTAEGIVVPPPGEYGIGVEQLTSMTRDQDLSSLQRYGGVKGLSKILKTETDKGISGDDAELLARKIAFGANTYPRKKGRSFWLFVWDAWQDRTLVILIVAAIVSLTLGMLSEGVREGWYDGGSIIFAVFIVVAVTATSDYKQSLQFQNLNKEKQNIHLEVIRGSRRIEVSIFDLVVGDIVPLKIGDQVPADGIFIGGHSMSLDESSMTGESKIVRKDQKAPFLMSGCKVADGYGNMLVTAVGMNTEWGLLMATIAEDNGEETPLQVRLNGVATLIGQVGLTVAAAVLVVLWARFFSGHTKNPDGSIQFIAGKTSAKATATGAIKFFTIAVTIVVVAVPEGLPLAVTLTLAYSMRKMMADKALVRRLSACETMGSATTICSDKTGTLTMNQMTVMEAYIGGSKMDPPDNIEHLSSKISSLLIEGIAQNTTGNIYEPEGSTKAGILGEATINIADYAEEFKPSSVSLVLKGSSTGALLHITLQRIQDSCEDRDVDANGVTASTQQRRTLQSELSSSGKDEGGKVLNGKNGITSTDQEDSIANGQTHLRNPSSRALPLRVNSCVDLRKSSSSDNISATGSESSSGQYTPKDNEIKNSNSHQDSKSFLSSLSSSGTPQKEMTSSFDWPVSAAPDGSMDRSTNSSAEAALRERLQDPDISLEKLRSDAVALARQMEISDLELQTLRKQVVKEGKRGQDLLRELSIMKEERDAVRTECEELKALQFKRTADDKVSNKLKLDGRDPWLMIDEIRQELRDERNLNSNLRVQLQKTQESNSELLLALRDLDQLLEQKNMELTSVNCKSLDSTPRASNESMESAKPHLQTSDGNREIFATISADDDEDQYELEELVKERGGFKTGYSVEEHIIDMKSEIELYRKDREELEMQMEQLALDYEIVKQENHDISSKLEQSQLREQLRMQYECSAHLVIINDLEAQVESLEKELANQAEAFEADLESIMNAKVEQEQRAIKAEELLRKTRLKNANVAERLQEEFKRLSEQMSSMFYANEKLATQAATEASELRLQKCHLEEMLEKSKEELASVQSQFQVKFKDLFMLVNMKTGEADKLLLELKKNSDELERRKKSEEAREKASLEELLVLEAEIEKLSADNTYLSERMKQKEQLANEMERLRSSEEDVNKLLEELDDWRRLNDEKETVIRTLNSEVETIKLQYTQLEHSLFEDEMENENLRKQVCQLRCELREKEDKLTNVEKKLKHNNAKLAVSGEATETAAKSTNNKSSPADSRDREVASLHEKIKLLEEEMELKDAALEDTKKLFSEKEKNLSSFCRYVDVVLLLFWVDTSNVLF